MSEIGGLHGRIGPHHGGRPLGKLAALMHDDDMVREVHDEPDIMLDQEHADIAAELGTSLAVSAVSAWLMPCVGS